MAKCRPSDRISTVSAERDGLVPLPGCPARGSGLVVQVTPASKSSVLLTGWGETTKLSVLVDRIAYPVHPWVISYGIVVWVNKDYFKVLVSWVLIDPVGIEDPKATQPTTSTLLSNRPLAPLELELSNSLVCGLTINNTLGHRPLTTTSSHTNPVDHNTLFGLVAKTAGLVGSRRVSDPNNGRELAILPASNPLDEPHRVRLLLPP